MGMDEFTRTFLIPQAAGRWRWPVLDGRYKGIAYMLAASVLFALMFALPKLADAGLNGVQATFIRYVTGFLTMLPVALWAVRRGAPLATPAWPLIVLRALFGVSGVSSVIYATTQMTYADALAISFADGVFILLLAGFVLGEKVSTRRWIAAVVCLSGAVICAQPSPDLLGKVWMEPAAGFAFLGALIMAGEVIVIKHLTNRVAATTLLLYTNGLAMLLAAGPALLLFDWPPLAELGYYALMGPVAIAGQFLFFLSLRCDDVSALVPYKYSTIVFAAVIGIFVFGQWPDAISVIGAVMIIGAGVQLSRLEGRTPKPAVTKETP